MLIIMHTSVENYKIMAPNTISSKLKDFEGIHAPAYKIECIFFGLVDAVFFKLQIKSLPVYAQHLAGF